MCINNTCKGSQRHNHEVRQWSPEYIHTCDRVKLRKGDHDDNDNDNDSKFEEVYSFEYTNTTSRRLLHESLLRCDPKSLICNTVFQQQL
jgi:hypothetical protein